MERSGAIVASVFFPIRSMFKPMATENLSVAMYSMPGTIESKDSRGTLISGPKRRPQPQKLVNSKRATHFSVMGYSAAILTVTKSPGYCRPSSSLKEVGIEYHTLP